MSSAYTLSPQQYIEQFGKRVTQKIESIGYSEKFFCYLLVEELLLLFNSPAVYVRLSKQDSGKTQIRDADVNITEGELRSLNNIFKRNGKELSLLDGVLRYSPLSRPKPYEIKIEGG